MARSIPGKTQSASPRLPGAEAQSPAERDIGAFLRVAFAQSESDTLPQEFIDLLDRLGTDEPGGAPPREGLSDKDFKAQLATIISPLRVHARALCGSADLADDLVQETLLKAWAARSRFQAGTNMRGWTYVILRNHYFTTKRRARFMGAWDELSADLILAEPANQEAHIALSDVQRAMLRLPAVQREALMLVGAGGLSYEEVAALCNCAVGTIKSRVARARVALGTLLDDGGLGPRGATVHGRGQQTMVEQIIGEVESLQQR